jgi:hypothetical protein
MVEMEIARRNRASREALERIWLEPLGTINYEPLDVLESGVDFPKVAPSMYFRPTISRELYRKTAPQPGDE